MSRSSRPPVDREAARELNQPTPRDRDRIRENIDRSLARGSASPTVLRVDASMAERALGATAPAAAGVFGSKLAVAKLLIPALLIGAGVGAIWARSLFDHPAPTAPANHSLPLDVEDLDPRDDAPAADFSVARAGAGAVGDSANAGPPNSKPPQPDAAEPNPPARAVRVNRLAHSEPSVKTPRAAPSEPAPPSVAAPEPPVTAPEAPSRHLAHELRLMRAASAALARNDIHRTLTLLSEHAERFPDGALREERRALRVISLCKQGRSHFALAERDELLSSSPRSPLTARVREACESNP